MATKQTKPDAPAATTPSASETPPAADADPAVTSETAPEIAAAADTTPPASPAKDEKVARRTSMTRADAAALGLDASVYGSVSTGE